MTVESATINFLVITAGFSRVNARIAVEMFRAGKLTNLEEEVINIIQLNLRSDRPLEFMNTASTMNHLNYRITTQHGGTPRNGR